MDRAARARRVQSGLTVSVSGVIIIKISFMISVSVAQMFFHPRRLPTLAQLYSRCVGCRARRGTGTGAERGRSSEHGGSIATAAAPRNENLVLP